MRAQEAMPRARELAQRALELDPDLPEAQAMLGIVAGHYDLDWREAERRFRLAVAHEPLSCHLRQWYAHFYLVSVGRGEEGRREMERVLKEDPLGQVWRYLIATVLAGLGLDDQALAASRKAVEIDPQFWIGWWWLGMLQAIHGRHAEARDCAERASAAAAWSPQNIGLLAGMLIKAGATDKAEVLLAGLRGDAYGGPFGLTCYHLVLGETDHAVEWAGKALDQRFTSIIFMAIRPFEPLLRQSAGWPALLKKINLA
jgi:tetratricopeptide (TPR) repeat protein